MKTAWQPVTSVLPKAQAQAQADPDSGVSELAIIIPVHNEAAALEHFDRELRQALHRAGVEADLLYVEDGSTDGSAQVLKRLGANALAMGANRGYGAAIKMGMRHTQSAWVAIIDADSTYDPEDLLRLWAMRQDADMVVGQRPQERGMRRLAKGLLHAIGSYAVDYPIPDINSGLRVFRREVAVKLMGLLPNGFSLTTTITLGALYTPYRVLYLPIAYRPRVGKSKIRPLRALNNFTMLLLRTMVLWAPLKFFLPPSFLFGAVGLGFLGRDLWAGDLAQTSILMLVNAFVLFSLGLIAEAVRARD